MPAVKKGTAQEEQVHPGPTGNPGAGAFVQEPEYAPTPVIHILAT